MEDSGSAGLRHAISNLSGASPEAIGRITASLLKGEVTPQSSPVRLRAVTGANPQITSRLAALVSAWRDSGGVETFSGESVALALSSAADAALGASKGGPHIEMVWSGPGTGRPGVRTTSELIRDIVRGARAHLLVVGYALTSKDLVGEFVGACRRGVRIGLVIHNDIRNRNALRQLWPQDAPFPTLLAWQPRQGHKMAKMHIKLVVGDGASMLVTSANITHLAMHENMEMGLHVRGAIAAEFVRHFDALEKAGVLTEVNLGQG